VCIFVMLLDNIGCAGRGVVGGGGVWALLELADALRTVDHSLSQVLYFSLIHVFSQ